MKPRSLASLLPFLVSLTGIACGGAAAPAPTPAAPTAPTAPPVASAASSSSSAPAAPTPPSASGIWLGTLHAGSKALRLQLRLDLAQTPPACTIDSLDQHAAGIPCTPAFAGSTLSLDVPAVHGSMKATLSADGNTLDGTWTQGMALPLVMTRQVSAIE